MVKRVVPRWHFKDFSVGLSCILLVSIIIMGLTGCVGAPTPTPAPTATLSPSPALTPRPTPTTPPTATPTPTATPSPTPTVTIGPTPTPTPTPKPSALTPIPTPLVKKGQALLGTGEGVSIISEGDWSVIDKSKGLPNNRVRAMAVDKEGRIWVAHTSGLSVLDQGRWTHYPSKTFGYHSIDALACDAQGRVWAGHYRGFYVLEKGNWKGYDGSILGLGKYVGVKDIAFDAKGQVWVATGAGISVFDGSKWIPYDIETSGLTSRYTEAIAVDHQSKVWVGHSEGVSVFDGSNWTNYGSGSKADFKIHALFQGKDIAVDEQGRIWVVTWARGVSVFEGGKWKTYDRANSGLVGGNGRAIACDGYGRVWVGTNWELAIFDGSRWLTYTQATSGLVTNGIGTIACIGDGPPSLPLPKEAQPGSASGKLTHEGAPIVGAEVNICWSVSWPIFFGSTPCKGEVCKAVTDSQGRFSITGIPIGAYSLAIRIMEGEKAKWYSGGAIGGMPATLHITSGKDTYLGELKIK